MLLPSRGRRARRRAASHPRRPRHISQATVVSTHCIVPGGGRWAVDSALVQPAKGTMKRASGMLAQHANRRRVSQSKAPLVCPPPLLPAPEAPKTLPPGLRWPCGCESRQLAPHATIPTAACKQLRGRDRPSRATLGAPWGTGVPRGARVQRAPPRGTRCPTGGGQPTRRRPTICPQIRFCILPSRSGGARVLS